jgi:hypothetical protein
MPLADRSAEKYLSRQGNFVKEAYTIYIGLLTHLDTDGALAPGVLNLGVRTPSGRAAAGAEVTIDGYLQLPADADGEVTLTALTPGSHQVEVRLHGHGSALTEFSWPPEGDGKVLRIDLAEMNE